MGKILGSGVMKRLKGNSHKVVYAFCDHIDTLYIKNDTEYVIHVFYFLH
jgi:hypothetical protein